MMQAVDGEQWVTDSEQSYINRAQQSAQKLAALRANRKAWREKLQSSALGNHAAFAAQLENLVMESLVKRAT